MAANAVGVFLRSRPLLSFWVLAYTVTWALWAPMVLSGVPAFSDSTHLPSAAALPAVAVGVTGTALFMTAVTQGTPGVRRMLSRLTDWRVQARWYLLAVPAIPLIQVAITAALVDTAVLRALTPAALAAYPAAYAGHFVFGPLFEEAGWRGFALPRMQHRFGPMRASVLLGLLWGGWHFLLYVPAWFSDGSVAGAAGMVSFVAFTTAISVVFTWLSNNTRASLLMAMLLHGSVNGTATYVQVLADRGIIPPDAAVFSAGVGALGAVVLLAGVAAVLTRRRLSYPRYRYEAEHLDLGRATAAA